MERDGISFADALKFASDLERITREAKLGARTEASVSKVERPMPQNFESTASASTSTDRSEFNIGSKQSNDTGANSRSSQSTAQQSFRPRVSGCWSCGSHEQLRATCVYFTRGLKCR